MIDSTSLDVTYEFKVFTAKGAKDKDRGYPPVSDQSEADLNGLIRSGWELVSTHTGHSGWMFVGTGLLWPVITFVLRRPVA
jgi:hypothetical protein